MGSGPRANILNVTPEVDNRIKWFGAVKTAVDRFSETRVSAACVRSLGDLEINLSDLQLASALCDLGINCLSGEQPLSASCVDVCWL